LGTCSRTSRQRIRSLLPTRSAKTIADSQPKAREDQPFGLEPPDFCPYRIPQGGDTRVDEETPTQTPFRNLRPKPQSPGLRANAA
jgi:hypothetical protein